MKFTCFIDACSYIYLTQEDYYVHGKTLLQLLMDSVYLKYSNEVYNEISRHSNSRMPSANVRAAAVYKLQKKSIKTYVEYEKRLFDSSSGVGDSDRGEKHNLAGILDHYFHSNSRSLIFLTDDKRAVETVINDPLFSFPVYHIWSSFDVILFLYLEAKGFNKEFAEAALRDMNSFLAKASSSGTRVAKTEARIKNFTTYMKRLDRISKLKIK